MHVVRIEHGVNDYNEWKNVFDSDPLGRKESGVVRYRVMRDADKVMIDLEFNSADEATQMEGRLRELWTRVDVMKDPQARVAEIVESAEL